MRIKEISKEEAIARIVRTTPSERVMRPSYGIAWHKYIDKGYNGLDLKADIYEAVSRYEDRAEIEEITAKSGIGDNNADIGLKVNIEDMQLNIKLRDKE